MNKYRLNRELVYDKMETLIPKDHRFRYQDKHLDENLYNNELIYILPIAHFLCCHNNRKVCKDKDFEQADTLVDLVRYIYNLDNKENENNVFYNTLNDRLMKIESKIAR